MEEFTVGIVTALWLGILTSISPCPLATNITAISYIGHRAGNPGYVFLTGLMYTVGRMVAYVGLAMLVVSAALSLPKVSQILQSCMHVALGPLLIVVGMVLLGLLSFNVGGTGVSERFRRQVDRMGIFGALLLGLVFALSFCPTSAALYFGSLIPLSLNAHSSILLPLAYGIGTAVPVLVFAGIIAFAAKSVGAAFDALASVERWARQVTGLIFIGIGIWFSLKYTFGFF